VITLHGYWRSGASWRVRIALNLKAREYRDVAHDLRRGEQADAAYCAINPQAMVPALIVDDAVFTQSLAMLEWLEERYPDPPLLPADPTARAHVRGIALTVACDLHPLGNLRVLNSLRQDLGADEDQVRAWIARWAAPGFAAIETLIARHGGRFAYGDTPTIADCCLIPQIYAARRFGVDLKDFPRIRAIDAHCAHLPAFERAHPANQPDAD